MPSSTGGGCPHPESRAANENGALTSAAHRMRAWIDLLLMSLTFFLTIIWNVEIGIAVSVVISLLLVVHRSSRPRMTILVRTLCFLSDSG